MPYTLRVSVVEVCQLRCGYCLPKGIKHLTRSKLLTLEQYENIAEALRAFDIEKIRFTGGEPLLRRDLPGIISIFATRFKVPIALTTNGQAFASFKEELVGAGLKSITFHSDTLKPDRYERLMGKAGTLSRLIEAVDDAKSLGLLVKFNVVVQKGRNDDELYDFLLFAQAKAINLRFIELMNTGSTRNFVQEHFMSGSEILECISHNTKLSPLPREKLSSPAEQYFAESLQLNFGLIASDTRPFCANCNRLRLSADGRLRNCLYEPQGEDLHLALNPNQSTLINKIEQIISKKTSYHPLQRKNREDFSMSQVGG